MSKRLTVEEQRADLIIKYRNLRKKKKEVKDDGSIVYHLTRGDENYVMLIILNQATIGIAYVRDLRDLVKAMEAQKGIMVGNGKYTYSAKSSAPKLGVELIPPTLPAFDMFKHKLVPKAEIVEGDERTKLVERYHAKPYQFPYMKAEDPVSIILGAEAGDIVKITSESETAGVAESYRYVV
jgi:DNA-directed RNA polymerase subunit H